MYEVLQSKFLIGGWQGKGMYKVGFLNVDGKEDAIIIVAETIFDLCDMFSDFIRHQNVTLSPADAYVNLERVTLK